MSTIRPGLGVEFVFHSDFIKDNIRIMRSMIYDIIDDRIILSPPSSDLLRSSLSKDIIVTYVIRRGDQETRYGFRAKIIDLMTDYELASGQRGQAVAIKQMSRPEPFDVRRFFRLRVPLACGLEMYLRDQKVNLVDISLGGAKFSHQTLPSLRPNDRTSVKMRIDERTFHLEVDVLRIWSPGGAAGSRGIKLYTIRFVNASREVEHVLEKKIFMIQRKMREEGKL